MSMFGRLVFFFIIGLFVVSCAEETTITKTKVRKDIWGHDEAYSVETDADGNPKMKSDKRSGFENKSSNIASNRDFKGKDYTTKSYRKDRWGGNNSFERKKYAGNTDASRHQKEPWFARKKATAGNQQSSAGKKKFSINPFRTKKASEQGRRGITSTQDAKVSNRRNAFSDVPITNWKDQKGLSVKDTNGMLGR